MLLAILGGVYGYSKFTEGFKTEALDHFVHSMSAHSDAKNYFSDLGINLENPISSMYYSQTATTLTIHFGDLKFSVLKSGINAQVKYNLNRLNISLVMLNDGSTAVEYKGDRMREVSE